jgi:hypothetical protein
MGASYMHSVKVRATPAARSMWQQVKWQHWSQPFDKRFVLKFITTYDLQAGVLKGVNTQA